MLPTPELEIARNLPAEGCTRAKKPSATRAGSRRTTTRISTSSRGCCRAICTSISTMSMPIAAGRTISATKSPIRARALELLDAWEDELRLIYRDGPRPSHPVLIALARDDSREGHSDRAVQRSAARVSAGSDGAPLRDLGRRARLLRLFGESGRAAGALSLRLSRRGAAAAFGFHVHGAAACEFLAGCFARPRKRPHLHSARCSRSARTDRSRHRRAAIRRSATLR